MSTALKWPLPSASTSTSRSALAIRSCRSSRLMWLGNRVSWRCSAFGISDPHLAVGDLALEAATPPTQAVAVPWRRVEFGILGPLEVRCGSDVVPIRRGLPRTILVALMLRRRHTVSSDFLVDVLWGDEQPGNPANALQTQISYLRKMLARAHPSGSSIVETRPGGYALRVEPDQIDAHRFEVVCRAFTPLKALCSETELLDALDEVDGALALWRGDALEDVASLDFARGEITRMEELRWSATERRVDLLLRLGRHGDAIGELSELVQIGRAHV